MITLDSDYLRDVLAIDIMTPSLIDSPFSVSAADNPTYDSYDLHHSSLQTSEIRTFGKLCLRRAEAILTAISEAVPGTSFTLTHFGRGASLSSAPKGGSAHYSSLASDWVVKLNGKRLGAYLEGKLDDPAIYTYLRNKGLTWDQILIEKTARGLGLLHIGLNRRVFASGLEAMLQQKKLSLAGREIVWHWDVAALKITKRVYQGPAVTHTDIPFNS